jgi:hypothetical protein
VALRALAAAGGGERRERRSGACEMPSPGAHRARIRRDVGRRRAIPPSRKSGSRARPQVARAAELLPLLPSRGLHPTCRLAVRQGRVRGHGVGLTILQARVGLGAYASHAPAPPSYDWSPRPARAATAAPAGHHAPDGAAAATTARGARRVEAVPLGRRRRLAPGPTV